MGTIIFIFFGLLGLFGNLVTAAVDTGCDCSLDKCVDKQGVPPYNTTCFVNVTANPVLQDHGLLEFQSCDNATYTDLNKATRYNTSDHGLSAHTADCKQLFSNYLSSSNLVQTSQLYNDTGVPLAIFGDCYLWLGGGHGATPHKLAPSDTFWMGNQDLRNVVSTAITSYGGPDTKHTGGDTKHTLAVCGTLPNCEFNNTATPETPVPDLSWCLGGSHVWDAWARQGGSHESEAVSQQELTPQALSNIDRSESSIVPRSANWYVRCQGTSLATCTTYYDTYCTNAGSLWTASSTCRRYCACIPIIIHDCKMGDWGIMNCYKEEQDKDKVAAGNNSVAAMLDDGQ